jgi:hypothetical protein
MAQNQEAVVKLRVTADQADALKRAFQGATAELQKQQEALDRIVRTLVAATAAAKQLGGAVPNLKGALNVPDAADKVKKEKPALDAVNDSLRQQEKLLERVNAAMGAEQIRKRAETELALAEANKKLNAAVGEEKRRQQGRTGAGHRVADYLAAKGGGSGLGKLAGGFGKLLGGKAEANTAANLGQLGAQLGGGGAGAAAGGEAAAAGGLGAALGPAAAAAGAAAAGIGLAVGALSQLTQTAVGFVAKSNPAVAQQLTSAFDDFAAVLGERLAPFVELVSKGVGVFADLLESILPSGEEVGEAFSFIGDYLNDLRDALALVAPLLKAVAKFGLGLLAGALKALTAPVRWLVSILAKFGLVASGGDKPKLKSAKGKGSHEASFGSVDDYLKKVQLGALASSRNTAKKPADKIHEAALGFAGATGIFGEAVKSLLDWLGKKDPGGQKGGAGAGAGHDVSAGLSRGMASSYGH